MCLAFLFVFFVAFDCFLLVTVSAVIQPMLFQIQDTVHISKDIGPCHSALTAKPEGSPERHTERHVKEPTKL